MLSVSAGCVLLLNRPLVLLLVLCLVLLLVLLPVLLLVLLLRDCRPSQAFNLVLQARCGRLELAEEFSVPDRDATATIHLDPILVVGQVPPDHHPGAVPTPCSRTGTMLVLDPDVCL